jgi:hypothetical protein
MNQRIELQIRAQQVNITANSYKKFSATKTKYIYRNVQQ